MATIKINDLNTKTSQKLTADDVSRITGGAGDYSGDGKVDAADYVVWRKSSSSVDAGDYIVWRKNLGTGL